MSKNNKNKKALMKKLLDEQTPVVPGDKADLRKYKAIKKIVEHGPYYDEWSGAAMFEMISEVVSGNITDFSSKNLERLFKEKT